MDLRHLQYFLTLAEKLHFGKAAESLFITQPPLSRQIKELEDELGVKLFKRTKKKVELTAYGEYLKNEAGGIFSKIDAIQNHLKLLKKGFVGQLKIGYVGAVMHSILPELLKELKAKLPAVNTTLLELGNEEQIIALRQNKIDIGFIRTPYAAEGIEFKKICDETLSLIYSKENKIGKKAKVKLSDFANEPFISPTQCSRALNESVASICRKAGFKPKITHETSQVNTILRLVESNLGYSIVPTNVKSKYSLKVKFVELSEYPERTEISLVFNPNNKSCLLEKVIEVIENYCKKISK